MAVLGRGRDLHRGLRLRPVGQRVRRDRPLRAQDEVGLQPAPHRTLRLRHRLYPLQHWCLCVDAWRESR